MPQTALILLLAFPFVGAIVAACMKSASTARAWAVLVGALTFGWAMVAGLGVGPEAVIWSNPALSMAEIGFSVTLTMDGVSLWLVLLATIVVPLAMLAAEKRVVDGPGGSGYFAWMLMLLGALNGAFLAADGLLFYFFFELTLVPSILLIGLWGGSERKQAAGKFFIYTFAGSVFLLIGLIYLAVGAQPADPREAAPVSFAISDLVRVAQSLPAGERVWIALAFLVGFLIKTPVFPLHTWQPLTYAEAPTSATVVFAAVLSKLGTYGLIRLAWPVGFVGLPADQVWLSHLVIALCLISIIYGGLVAWVQKDMVRLMAYSSLSHLGLCVLAIFAGSTLSLQGAVAYMVAHGLSTAGVMLIISMIASRTGTRDINELSGLFARMPVLSTLLVIFVLASIGLPITAGFVGEFLSLQGVMVGHGLVVTILAGTGMVLGAIYMLHMVAKVGFGPLKHPEGADLRDADAREFVALMPLVATVFLMGVLPTPMLESFKPDVQRLASEQTPLVVYQAQVQDRPE